MAAIKLKLFLLSAKDFSMASDSVVSEVVNLSWVQLGLIIQLLNVHKATNDAQTWQIRKIPFAIQRKACAILSAPLRILRSLRTLQYLILSILLRIIKQQALSTRQPQWYTLVTQTICQSLLLKLSNDPVWTRSISQKPHTSISTDPR